MSTFDSNLWVLSERPLRPGRATTVEEAGPWTDWIWDSFKRITDKSFSGEKIFLNFIHSFYDNLEFKFQTQLNCLQTSYDWKAWMSGLKPAVFSAEFISSFFWSWKKFVLGHPARLFAFTDIVSRHLIAYHGMNAAVRLEVSLACDQPRRRCARRQLKASSWKFEPEVISTNRWSRLSQSSKT